MLTMIPQTRWEWLWSLVMVYPGLCLGYFLLHRYFIMHPSRKLTRTPADLDMAYEEVYFSAADRVRLQGWFIPGADGGFTLCRRRPVMLFFPGNEGTLSKFVPQMHPWQAAGFDILMFSYRGFGKSGCRWPSEAGLRRDARGAWTYLVQTRGLLPSQIIFFAQSIGCGLASWAAAEFKPAALILEGGFPSVGEITARAVPWLPVRLLTTERFDTRRHLGRVTCPVLIAHSRDDQAVPFAYSQILWSAARIPKELLTLQGAHAAALDCMPVAYMKSITGFLHKYLSC